MTRPRPVLGSVTRRAGLRGSEVTPRPIPRAEWRLGDFVVGEVLGAPGGTALIECTTGRMAEVVPGDLVVGALGDRAATLEAVGGWRDVGEDGVMDGLTRAGLLGRAVSATPATRAIMPRLAYVGHVAPEGPGRGMADVVGEPPDAALTCPVVLIVGTSMAAGKTLAARTAIRRLVRAGLRVAGVKLTGAARYRDILAMADAGAEPILDFVDAGLPSTIAPADVLERALHGLLARAAAAGPDVLVAEAGASPLEPYGGDTAVRLLDHRVAVTVLCASDPYAVLGVMRAFRLRPDAVAGWAAATTAGRALVERLTGVPTVDLLAPDGLAALDELLLPLAVPAPSRA